MKTSIVLCTYNGEQFLQEQLDSYLKQTKLPYELIVSDDGSTDNTMAILFDFQSKAPFRVSIEQNKKRLGSAKNFIQTLRRTTGDIVLLSDQDDIWFIDKIETYENLFFKEPMYRFLFSNAELVDSNGDLLVPDFHGITRFQEKWHNRKKLPDVLLKNYGFVNGFLIGMHKKFVLEINNFFVEHPEFELNMGHDHFIAIMAGLLYENESIKEIYKVLVQYRQHQNQVIGADYKAMTNQPKSLSKVASEKKHRFQQFAKYLNEYFKIINILEPESERHTKLKKAMIFNQSREELVSKSKLLKLIFIIKHFFTRKYKKYTQNPIKEAVRDFL